MELIKIDPARRRKYRIAIYTGFAILLVTLTGMLWVLRTFFRPEIKEAYTEEELLANPDVQLFQEYVRIDTTIETGSELEGAKFLARQLEAVGIEPVIEPLGENKANVWGILEGEERGAIVLHNHVDVYKVADPEAWNYPPFGAEVKDVWLFGRGTFDMKSVAITQLRALQELAKSGQKPRKSVIFLATGGEETGSDLGARWILEHHPELTSRFDLVLTEGGVVEPKSHDEIKYWGVEFAQKQFASVRVCSDSRERLEELREDILLLRGERERWRLTDEVETFVGTYADSRDSPVYQDLLRDSDATLRSAPQFAQLPDYLKAGYRDEVVPLTVEEGEDGALHLRIFLHVLPGGDLEAMRSLLLPDWMLHGLTVIDEPLLGSHKGSSVTDEAFQTIVATIRDHYPDTLVGPYFLPWSGTDSRFFREAGIASYGFSPFNIFSTDTYRVDAVDERISLPGFLSGLDLYVDLLGRLAGAPALTDS